MARKKKSHKMNPVRKWLRIAVNASFKVIGAGVVGIPLYRGLRNLAGGDIEGGFKDILFDTTGISEGTGPNPSTLAKTAVSTLAGLGIAWLGGQVARRL